MHDGSLATLAHAIDHCIDISPNLDNTNLYLRLQGPPINLTGVQKSELVALLKTLSGPKVYTAEQWSNPFDENGNLNLLGVTTIVRATTKDGVPIKVYPKSFRDYFSIETDLKHLQVDFNGSLVKQSSPGSGKE